MISYYLGEDVLLDNVTTYPCVDPERRAEVLDRLDELVLKPVDGYGGQGIVIGPHADAAELARVAEAIRADPAGWVAQDLVQLSTHPTYADGKLEPRAVDLRAFVLQSRRRRAQPHVEVAAGHAEPGGPGRQHDRQLVPGRGREGHLGAALTACSALNPLSFMRQGWSRCYPARCQRPGRDQRLRVGGVAGGLEDHRVGAGPPAAGSSTRCRRSGAVGSPPRGRRPPAAARRRARPLGGPLRRAPAPARSPSGVSPESRITPSASSPASRSVFGPRAADQQRRHLRRRPVQRHPVAAARTGRRRRTVAAVQQLAHRRRVLAQQPHRRRDARADLRHPVQHAVPEAGQEPAREQPGQRWRSPSRPAPGCAAAPAAARRPTRSRSVQASAAVAAVSPPSRKQSSHSHSSATPAASAACATSRSRSGGSCGRNVTPSVGSVMVRPHHARRQARTTGRPGTDGSDTIWKHAVPGCAGGPRPCPLGPSDVTEDVPCAVSPGRSGSTARDAGRGGGRPDHRRDAPPRPGRVRPARRRRRSRSATAG